MQGRGGRKKVLDIGCGSGISSDGYATYFDVFGIDNSAKALKHYPYAHELRDALTLTVEELQEFDLVHLGGPCQPWSKMSLCLPGLRDEYPDLITPLRPKLLAAGVPYVIENVEGSPLIDPIWLCGLMFGKELYRHRGFEAGNGLVLPPLHHPQHVLPASKAGPLGAGHCHVHRGAHRAHRAGPRADGCDAPVRAPGGAERGRSGLHDRLRRRARDGVAEPGGEDRCLTQLPTGR